MCVNIEKGAKKYSTKDKLFIPDHHTHIVHALSKDTGIATLSPDYRNYSVPFEPHETVMVHFDQNVVMHFVTVLGKF